MEEIVRRLVARIENSNLMDTDKDRLYVEMQHAIRSAVRQALISHVSKDDLKRLVHNRSAMTVDAYVRLICDAVKEEAVIEEMHQSMIDVLTTIEQALTEAGV